MSAATTLLPEHETAIRGWLTRIGETKDYEIRNTLDKCRRDPSALAYFLKRAAEPPPPDVFSGWQDGEIFRRGIVEAGSTVVANRQQDKALVRWAEYQGIAVDIGRDTGGKITEHRPWGNPFVLDKESNRKGVIDKFDEYLDQTPELLGRIEELRGKVLVCYCWPKRCHGDVYVRRLSVT